MTIDAAFSEALALLHDPDEEPGTVLAAGPAALDSFGLTPREHEILALLCRRLTNKEIAEALFVSPRTIQTHTISIFGTLGVANRRDAASLAVRRGLA